MKSHETVETQVLNSIDLLLAYKAEHHIFHVLNAHLFTEHEDFGVQFLQLLHLDQLPLLEAIHSPCVLDEFVNCLMEYYNQQIQFNEYNETQIFSKILYGSEQTMSEDNKSEIENLSLINSSLDTIEGKKPLSAGSPTSKNQKRAVFAQARDEIIYATLVTTKGGMTRSELVEITGMPRSTIHDCLARLLVHGKIKRSPQHLATVGRPKVYFESCSVVLTTT